MTSPATALVRLVDPRTWLHVVKLVNFYAYAHVEQRRKITAGPQLRMSPSVSLRNGERITLGREVHIGERCCLWAGDSTGAITLGDNALLGPEVMLTASNYRTDAGVPVMHQDKLEADIHIGSDAWLGARVVVTAGVTIGDGAIVGAAAVVTRSLPAGCIAVGVPAKVVGWRAGSEPSAGATASASPPVSARAAGQP